MLTPELAAYTNEASFRLEEEKLFRAGWLCVAHVSELPNPGDYLALEASPELPKMIAEESVLLRDFHVEDMEVNEAVQTGLRSRHAVRGRLSHLEEPVWLIRRYLAAWLAAACPAKASRKPCYGSRTA